MVKIYSKIRLVTSPIIWWLLYKRKWNLEWRADFALCNLIGYLMEDYEHLLSTFPYRADYLKGAIDASVPRKYIKWFFMPLKRGRDCDEFARAWSMWGEYRGLVVKEYIIKEKGKWKGHIFTTLRGVDEGMQLYLCDKKVYEVKNLDEAIGIIVEKYGYKKYKVVEYEYKKELF